MDIEPTKRQGVLSEKVLHENQEELLKCKSTPHMFSQK